MDNGQWKMKKWRVESGEWRMGKENEKMENGKWKIKNGD